MDRQFRVGLTGGVGSGKTTVANLLAKFGASIVDTDVISRELTSQDGAAMPAIIAHFGSQILDEVGALHRRAMRARIFSDPDARHELEAILHPMIRAESLRQCESADGVYVVLVVPLLVEHLSDYRSFLDRIAVVDCDLEEQVARTAERPGLDAGQARAIAAAQIDRSSRLAVADDIIENRSDLDALQASIEQLHERYAKLAAEKSALKQNY